MQQLGGAQQASACVTAAKHIPQWQPALAHEAQPNIRISFVETLLQCPLSVSLSARASTAVVLQAVTWSASAAQTIGTEYVFRKSALCGRADGRQHHAAHQLPAEAGPPGLWRHAGRNLAQGDATARQHGTRGGPLRSSFGFSLWLQGASRRHALPRHPRGLPNSQSVP